VTPDGVRAVSGSGDGTARVWNLTTGREQASFTGHTGEVFSVALTPDRGRAVSSGSDGTVRVWDLAAGREHAVLTGHTGWVWSVAAAELDGRPVAVSGSADRTVRVWDLATGTPIGDPFTGRTGPVKTLAVRIAHRSGRVGASAEFGAGAGNVAAVASITALGEGAWRWAQTAAPELGSSALALAWATRDTLITGTGLGLVILDFPSS
jgi:WD40 repeat protein